MEPGFRSLRKVVTDVREVSRLRIDATGDFQRLVYAQMRWMRSVPQCIDDQDFYTRDKLDNRIRHRAAVA